MKNIVIVVLERIFCYPVVNKRIDSAAYTIVLGESHTLVLVTVGFCHIMVLAIPHRYFRYKLLTGKIVHQIGKIPCHSTEALECEHLVIVENLFHTSIQFFLLNKKFTISRNSSQRTIALTAT